MSSDQITLGSSELKAFATTGYPDMSFCTLRGVMDPKCIRPAERRLIVSYLMADGYSTADIAQILKVSDRSIERDKNAVREANAIAADPQLVEQMVGRLVLEADLSIQRIRAATKVIDA